VTVTEPMFDREGLRAEAGQRLANVAAVLATHPELSARVEGYADSQEISQAHARAVRDALVASGARPNAVAAIGYGELRPIASGATAAGREENRRVEVVISGPSIGNQATWDQGYSLRSGR
jgi:outer membrane protein OmpA-like peptidoglycan-associated protein